MHLDTCVYVYDKTRMTKPYWKLLPYTEKAKATHVIHLYYQCIVGLHFYKSLNRFGVRFCGYYVEFCKNSL